MTPSSIGFAVLYTIFLWWFSTGAIVWLDRRPRASHRWSMAGASIVAALAVFGIVVSMKTATVNGALISFTCALGVWGWHEMSFLMGFITGPRTDRCPASAFGWRRFLLATSTLIYHEIALFLTALILVAISWGQPNEIGAWTFLILLVSRLSAKLNIFLGVPNFSDEFFPDHLRYLSSYLRKSRMNGLFPLSIACGGAVVGLEAWLAARAEASAFQVTGSSLLFALTALALIEHAFMVLPLPDAALWRWAMPASDKVNTAASPVDV